MDKIISSDKKAKINMLGFSIEVIGAGFISFGVFSIPLKLFGNELFSELIIAVGTVIMIIGRFLR